MPAMASLSESVKSTPFVCAPSRNVVSNKKSRSRAIILTAIEPIDRVKRYDDCRGYHRVFQDQIVDPVLRKRRLRAFHDGLPRPVRGLVMVVLASHSSPSETVLRLCAENPRFSKKPRAASLASTVSSLVPRAAASFSSASHSIAPAPCLAAAGCT